MNARSHGEMREHICPNSSGIYFKVAKTQGCSFLYVFLYFKNEYALCIKKHLFHSDKNNQYLSMLNVRLFWLLRRCQATYQGQDTRDAFVRPARSFL